MGEGGIDQECIASPASATYKKAPPSPPPAPAPTFCGAHFQEAECEADKGCHWCSSPWNMCFAKSMKCPP